VQGAAVKAKDFSRTVFAAYFPMGLLKHPNNMVALIRLLNVIDLKKTSLVLTGNNHEDTSDGLFGRIHQYLSLPAGQYRVMILPP